MDYVKNLQKSACASIQEKMFEMERAQTLLEFQRTLAEKAVPGLHFTQVGQWAVVVFVQRVPCVEQPFAGPARVLPYGQIQRLEALP